MNDNISPRDIKKRYMELARRYHPDVNPNNPNANINIQIINAAYELLKQRYGRN